MSEKSDKLRAMLEKEKERRIKLNNRIEILERRIQEEDSAEVNEDVYKRQAGMVFRPSGGRFFSEICPLSSGSPVTLL